MLRRHTIHSSRPDVGLAHPSLSAFPLSHQRPPFPEIQELAGKCRLHTTDEDIVLLVHNPTPAHCSLRPAVRTARLLGDKPIRVYVPLLTRPWIMQAGHSTASCHLGTARASISHARAFLLVDRNEHVHLLVVAPLLEVPSAGDIATDGSMVRPSIPLPPGPSIAVSVGWLGPLPVRPGGDIYTFFSPTALAVVRTCSPSPPLNLQLQARLTSL